MEPTASNGGAHTPIPGDWQPTLDSPRKSLTLNNLCLALNILVILADTGNCRGRYRDVAALLTYL
jgi:hypothetical protein